ncbi:hypothetical protein O0J73_13150, partial [Stenotrophomonas sp. Sm6012]|uniref:hypothetical protein n=1 Tax=Stenotrophomonas sp. Sm6012 TaxID=3002745 RepID=UPI0027E513C0
MGLDMFAGKTRKDVVDNTAVPIMEWRKHPDLHGYMQALYASRSGCKDPMKFNKKPLFLSRQDLEDLRQAVLSGQLPKTEGHFFGESLPEELDRPAFRRHPVAIIDGNDRGVYGQQ